MKRRLLHLVVALMAFAATTIAQSLSVAPIEATPGTETTITVNIAGAAEMTALQCNLQLPEGLTLAGDIALGDAAKGHTLSTSTLASGDLLVVLYSLQQATFADGTLLTIPVVAAEDAASGEARLYTVHTATAAAVSHTLSNVAFAMNIASEEPEPTWHLSGPATEEEVTTQSYIDGLVYNQTNKPSTITLKKGYNVIIIPSSWTTPTFGLVSDFSKRYTPFTANDLGITNPSNKNVLVLYSEVENATCYVKWGTNVVPEPEPEPEAKYYWYAGTTDPTTMTSIDPIIPADAASYVYGWTEITEAPTEIRVFKESSNWQETGLFPEVQWYIAFPAEFNLGMVGGGWTKSQTVINGVLYDIWTCGTLVDTANSQFIKLETPDYTPDPETKCYWYVGTTDPRTMTNIDPIIPADAASYVYGWTEITETPTMIDVFKESSNWEETGLFPDVQWYIACPSAYGFNTTSYLIPVGGWYVIRNAVTIGGIEYDIWKCQTLTSAVATLLAKVGEPVSKPEPEPEGLIAGKNYRVKNVTTGLYLQVEGNNTNMKLQNRADGVELSQVFQLEDASEGMYYIKAADLSNSYYAHASGWNFNATANAANKTPFTIALVEGEEGVYTLHQSVSDYKGLAGADAAEAGAAIYCDKGVDNNCKWAFEPLTEEENAAYVTTLTATARQAVEEAIARGEAVAANRSAVLTAEETAAINNAVQAAKEGKDAAADVTALKALSDAIHTAVDEAIYVWNTDALSNAMCYAVSTEDRGAWYAQASNLTSTAKAEVAVDVADSKQQFAFVKSEKSGALYLYSVSEAKFVSAADGYTALTETPVQTVAFLNGTRSARFPWVVALNAEDGQKQMGISNGYDPAVITHYNDLGDGGNTVRIEKVAAFDASAALAAIEALENPVIAVTGITLSQTAATLTEGESITLTATVAPDNATDKTVTWSSSNTAVATVDNNGVVTAVAEGTATITVMAGGKEATCVVTVEKKIISITGITLNQNEATLTEGETLTLTATVAPDNATDKTVAWSSSNVAVATVGNNGVVTAVAEGTAIITAKAGDKEATCVVTVKSRVPDGIDQLTMDNSQLTIYDLMGRKVENPAKGIYIINGRKVVIK